MSEGTVTLGKYELLTRLACGGMAELYVARERSKVGERIVVVKRLLPEHSGKAEFVRMFEDEARIAVALTHPNVVQMFEFALEQECHFLAMEYLHGEDMRTIARARRHKGERLPLDIVVNVLLGACAGLHYAHEARDASGAPLQIVHRDVSPHNLFVTFDGAVKVLDFGIAQAQNRKSATRHGALKGKIPYMSPEQLRGERVDRRTDIYALGVVLHELALGGRPYVATVPGGGEFALMMAIAQGSVRKPSQVDPAFPPELERIIVRAMQRDPSQRYATAREMQVELEAFARARGLAVSSLNVANFMEAEFGAKVEAWRDALANGVDLAEHVIAFEEERLATNAGDTSDVEGAGGAGSGGKPLPDMAGSGVEVSERAVGTVRVLSLAGRLTEAFRGRALGGALSGTTVLDLAQVERITSYGVREWLEMLDEARGHAALYFCRCSEPIVNQLGMIRGFDGGGHVVSFVAPYLCRGCGATSERVIDCERHGADLAKRRAPAQPCPSCGGEALLDDDASWLAFCAPYAGRALPAEVRAAVDSVTESAREPDAVEKVVSGKVTTLRVRSELGRSLRWNRILDGTEGTVVVDLQDATAMQPDGIKALISAIAGLDPEVESVEIVGARLPVIEALATHSPSRVQISSVLVEGACDACAIPRAAVVPMRMLRAAVERGERPAFPCKRCGTPLRVAEADALFGHLGLAVGRAPASSEASSPPGLVSPAPPAGVSARRAGGARRGPLPLPLAAAAAVVALAGAALLFTRAGRTHLSSRAEASTAVVASAAPTSSEARNAPVLLARVPPQGIGPEWARERFAVRGDDVYVVGGGSARDEAEALRAAQASAIRTIVTALARDMHDGSARRLSAPSAVAGSDASVVARYLEQVGAFATPERVDAVFRASPDGVEALARYRLAARAYRDALALYEGTVVLGGLTLANALPGIDAATDASVVVVAVDAKSAAARERATPGDGVLKLDGRAVSSVTGLSALVGDGHAAEHTVVIDGAAGRRTLHIAH